MQVEDVLKALESAEYIEHKLQRAATQLKAELAGPLQRLMADSSARLKSRTLAMALYPSTGVELPWTALEPLLAEDANTQRAVLRYIALNPSQAPPQLLEWADHSDQKTRLQAWETLSRRQVEGWKERLLGQLDEAPPEDRAQLARLLASSGEPRAAEVLDQVDPSTRWLWESLSDLCGHPATRGEGLRIARRHAATGQAGAGRVLAEHGEALDVPVLRTLRSQADPFSSELMEAGLIRLEGLKALPDIQLGLSDPDRRCGVISAIHRVGFIRPELKSSLLALEPGNLNFQEAFQLCELLIQLGLTAEELKPYRAKVLKSDQSKLDRKLKGWTPAVIASKLRKLGLIDGGKGNTLREILEDSGRGWWFDAEAASPPDYESLVDQLARISGGKFQPQKIHQEIVDGRVRLRFVHGSTPYTTDFVIQDDWIDTDPLLTAPNQALEQAQVAERFHYLNSFGQEAAVLFADPQALDTAVKDGLLER